MSPSIEPAGLAELRSALRGVVVSGSDRDYDDARRVPDATVDRRPDALVRVTGPADVARVLRFARARSSTVSVRGGGHGVAGHAVAGDIVIDLSALRGVRVDEPARTATVRAGSVWGDVDSATQAYGLAVPGGRFSQTGVAGHTLGGGHGWLSPRHGLSCDNLLRAELVTADGQVVTASETTEPDLFWALRGGGGRFGAVTSFTFRLQPLVGPVLGGLILYSLAEAPEVVATVAELGAQDPGFAGAVVLLSAPPLAFVPGDLVGKPVVGLVPAWLGDPDRGRTLLRPLRTRLRPLAGAAASMSYDVLQSGYDAAVARPVRQQWAGAMLTELPAGRLELLCDAMTEAPSRRSAIVLTRLGAAVAREPAGGTAFGHRDKTWWVQFRAAWTDPSEDDANRHWADLVRTLLGAWESPAEQFETGRRRRLAEVKRHWDPDDVFRHCPPADTDRTR